MEDVIFSLNFFALFSLALGAFLINYLLLRKYIFFWFDPLLNYIVFNSCSIAFVIYLYFGDQKIETFYVVTFLTSTVGFLFGLVGGSKLAIKKIKANKIVNSKVATDYDQVFDVFMLLCIIILVGSNLLMLIGVGTLPIFSADPSSAKVELYTGGWGIVRRVDLVCVNFIFSIALLKLFHPINKISLYKKKFCWFSVAIAIAVLFTMGAKSSLIGILNSLFGVAMINGFCGESLSDRQQNINNNKTIRVFGKYTLIAAFAYMFLVIVKSGVETSAWNTFVTRLVGSGDTFYYFYAYNLYDNFRLGPADFLSHIVNPLLGFFRVAPYEYPLGAYMLNYAFDLPLSSFGPNAQHPIEGLLYFGKVGTFFYSFSIGLLMAQIRLSLLNRALKTPNFLHLVLYVSMASIVVAAAFEINYFMLLFYDIVMFGSVLFFISLSFVHYIKLSRSTLS